MSNTATELTDLAPLRHPSPPLATAKGDDNGRRLGSHEDGAPVMETRDLPSPSTASPVVEKWNFPQSNIFRVFACFWSLMVTGANDAAYGALLPYLQEYYKLDYLVVSLIFLSPFVGYIIAASMNNFLHLRFGQRGIGIICGAAHIAAYLIISQHPPYPVLVVAYVIAGFGNGIGDAAWNAWVGNLARANELLGFLHAFYGVGGTISPLIATAMITQLGLQWYHFYYVLLAISVVELVACTWSFWANNATSYRESISHTDAGTKGALRSSLFTAPYARVTWVCSAFLVCYVGCEVSLGGWLVQFMIRVRDAAPFDAGMTSVGFWLGLTLGRATLGFVTPRIGVKIAVSAYLTLTMGLQLIFWLVPQFYVSAVAVALQGYFLGPLFPAIVVVATALLPRHLHVSTIGFIAAFGGSGAAVLPFAVGAIAQAKGVQVLQPIILAFLVVLLGLWLCLPRLGKKRD
ncbi:major facilitator superfamily domain-containing protein [Plectosphaerella plurivora]|uniref:Major facilitator superfamily domain-containing protein n=1 Tax=Plectosphaerella plurivora TaxID=936078 RepID=A0A9P8VK14_9PEZI|nr:major facilitator superfamily domain-containing protein [Plectosphaerella plurivora]